MQNLLQFINVHILLHILDNRWCLGSFWPDILKTLLKFPHNRSVRDVTNQTAFCWSTQQICLTNLSLIQNLCGKIFCHEILNYMDSYGNYWTLPAKTRRTTVNVITLLEAAYMENRQGIPLGQLSISVCRLAVIFSVHVSHFTLVLNLRVICGLRLESDDSAFPCKQIEECF